MLTFRNIESEVLIRQPGRAFWLADEQETKLEIRDIDLEVFSERLEPT